MIFPTVPETGTANAAIKEYAPVMIDAANDLTKIIPVAKEAKQAQSVLLLRQRNGEPVTYYMTGEFLLTH